MFKTVGKGPELGEKKLKVALFRDMPEERWYSMDVYADRLTQALRTQCQLLDIVPFIANRPFPHLTGKPGSFLSYMWRLGVYPLKAGKVAADIYHVLDHSYGHLVYSLDSRKAVVTCHDIAPLVLRNKFRNTIGVKIWDRSFRGALKAARIIAISESTKRDIVRFTHCNPQKIKVIYFGIEDYFKPVVDKELIEKERARFAIENQHIILHVGNCHWRKNIKTILMALSFLKKKKIDFVFLQVGGRWPKDQQEMIQKLSLENHVKQLSFVKPEQLPLIYNIADVFVFPSLYEGFGMPPLEAMACGVPVVVSDVSSLPEVVGEAGIMISPQDSEALADAVINILGNSVLRGELQQKGIRRVHQFSWSKTALETFEVYKAVFSEVS